MSAARADRLMVAPRDLHEAALAVHVLRPHPVGECVVGPVFPPPLRRRIEIPVDTEELLPTTPVRRVGVEDTTGLVPDEDAVTGPVLQPGIPVLVVVEGAACRKLVGSERDVKVETQGKRQPICGRTASISSIGARATTVIVTSSSTVIAFGATSGACASA